MAVEYVLEGVEDDGFLHMYLDKEYTSHYAWVFPHKSTTKVGLIGKFAQLDRFVESLGASGIKGGIVRRNASLIPCGKHRLYENGILYLGDSARMCNPSNTARHWARASWSPCPTAAGCSSIPIRR